MSTPQPALEIAEQLKSASIRTVRRPPQQAFAGIILLRVELVIANELYVGSERENHRASTVQVANAFSTVVKTARIIISEIADRRTICGSLRTIFVRFPH